jgi:hypothetical protein
MFGGDRYKTGFCLAIERKIVIFRTMKATGAQIERLYNNKDCKTMDNFGRAHADETNHHIISDYHPLSIRGAGSDGE